MIEIILECITRAVVIGGVLVLGLGAAAMIYTSFNRRKWKNNMEIVERLLQDPRVTKFQVGDCVVKVLEKKGFNTGVTVAKHNEVNYRKPKNRDGDEFSTIV